MSRRISQGDNERPEPERDYAELPEPCDSDYDEGERRSYDYITPSYPAGGAPGILSFAYCDEHNRRYPSGGKCPMCP